MSVEEAWDCGHTDCDCHLRNRAAAEAEEGVDRKDDIEARAEEAWIFYSVMRRDDWTEEQNFKAAVRGALFAFARKAGKG